MIILVALTFSSCKNEKAETTSYNLEFLNPEYNDQALNPKIPDLDKLSVCWPELTPLRKTTLPSGWIADQIFKVNAFYDGKPVDINLVPFAFDDASQTEEISGGDKNK